MITIRRLFTIVVSAALGVVAVGAQGAFATTTVTPGGSEMSSSGPTTLVVSGGGLSTWQIAIIAVGVAAVSALATIASGRFVTSRRLQHSAA